MFLLINNNGRFQFVRKGALTRLPTGYRFHPTDQELIIYYLKNKVMSCPLPPHFIPEMDVWNSDPWDLPALDFEEEKYFFCKQKQGTVPNGEMSSGFWKNVGIDKKIVISSGNQLVGMKKTLIFYTGKPENCSNTNWTMHEYSLAGDIKPMEGLESAPMENWVLCRVFLKEDQEESTDDDDESGSSRITHEPDDDGGDGDGDGDDDDE